LEWTAWIASASEQDWNLTAVKDPTAHLASLALAVKRHLDGQCVFCINKKPHNVTSDYLFNSKQHFHALITKMQLLTNKCYLILYLKNKIKLFLHNAPFQTLKTVI